MAIPDHIARLRIPGTRGVTNTLNSLRTSAGRTSSGRTSAGQTSTRQTSVGQISAGRLAFSRRTSAERTFRVLNSTRPFLAEAIFAMLISAARTSSQTLCLAPPRQPRSESGLAEPFHHILQMRAVPRFDHDFEQGALGGQVRERALMRDLDDVGAGFGE
jgi:hypothetical protein